MQLEDVCRMLARLGRHAVCSALDFPLGFLEDKCRVAVSQEQWRARKKKEKEKELVLNAKQDLDRVLVFFYGQ